MLHQAFQSLSLKSVSDVQWLKLWIYYQYVAGLNPTEILIFEKKNLSSGIRPIF